MPALTPRHLSPLLLAQEFVRDDPWQLLATCILLNRTNGTKQVKPVLADFFEKWPTPEAFVAADVVDVKTFLRPLGFQNIRYDRLLGLSVDWVSGKRPPDKIRGVGRYAKESYEIFVQGLLILDPSDKELHRYVKWAKEEGTRRDGDDVHHDRPGRVQSGLPAAEQDACV